MSGKSQGILSWMLSGNPEINMIPSKPLFPVSTPTQYGHSLGSGTAGYFVFMLLLCNGERAYNLYPVCVYAFRKSYST